MGSLNTSSNAVWDALRRNHQPGARVTLALVKRDNPRSTRPRAHYHMLVDGVELKRNGVNPEVVVVLETINVLVADGNLRPIVELRPGETAAWEFVR